MFVLLKEISTEVFLTLSCSNAVFVDFAVPDVDTLWRLICFFNLFKKMNGIIPLKKSARAQSCNALECARKKFHQFCFNLVSSYSRYDCKKRKRELPNRNVFQELDRIQVVRTMHQLYNDCSVYRTAFPKQGKVLNFRFLLAKFGDKKLIFCFPNPWKNNFGWINYQLKTFLYGNKKSIPNGTRTEFQPVPWLFCIIARLFCRALS